MDFELTSEHKMLRDTVRSFVEKEIKPVARDLDEKEMFSPELTKRMGEMGFFGIIFPEEYGGQGLDYLSYILTVEELARVDASQASVVTAGVSLGMCPIYYFGNETQKKKYLPRLCSGEMLWGFGLTEPNAGSDAGSTSTTAVLDGNEWVINGQKIFITNSASEITGGVTVQAVTGTRGDGRKESSCILVESGTRGFTQKAMHGKLCWRASNTGELYFEDVRVPKENLLGKPGEGFHQMLATLDGGRLSVGAMGLGGAQGAFEEALKYSQERVQFGKPISNFQVNSFKLADMYTKIEQARLLLYKATWLREQNRPFAIEAAMAKLVCSEVFHYCANEAVQLHGGYGLMKEFPVERFYRDQKLLEIGEGTSEIQRLVIARHVIGRRI